MKRVLLPLLAAVLVLAAAGPALADPPQSLQVYGSGTVLTETAFEDEGGDWYSSPTGTASVNIHARSTAVPTLEYEDAHPFLSSPARGSVTIRVDDPGVSLTFTAQVIELRTMFLDVISSGILQVVFDSDSLPAEVADKNVLYISDMAASSYPDHIHLWFLGHYLGVPGSDAYSPLDLDSGNFVVKGWTYPEPWF